MEQNKTQGGENMAIKTTHTQGRGQHYGEYLIDMAEQYAADLRYRQSILGDEGDIDAAIAKAEGGN